MPKTLLPYGDGTILSRIIGNFTAIGVSQFTIVIGFKGDMIRGYLDGRHNFGHDISLIENLEYERGNGVSVLKARAAIEDGAFLSMSDHLVHPDGLNMLKESTGNALLTDSRINDVFDIDDATKVRAEHGRIVEIGKELSNYNAIDCGVFRIDNAFMDALQAQIAEGKESISHGVQSIIATSGFTSVPMPQNGTWIDIDTPAAYEFALGLQDRFRT